MRSSPSFLLHSMEEGRGRADAASESARQSQPLATPALRTLELEPSQVVQLEVDLRICRGIGACEKKAAASRATIHSMLSCRWARAEEWRQPGFTPSRIVSPCAFAARTQS